MDESVEVGIARRALRHVLEPPSGNEPVVRFASPETLVEAFRATVGLELDDDEPSHGRDEVLAAVDQVVDYSVHTNHPRFLNQNFAGADPIAVVGDWLGAALNTTAATYEAAPVFTLIERSVLDKLARLAGYPVRRLTSNRLTTATPPGIFCPGGSTATLFALQLARHRRDPDIVRRGAGAERLVLFVSDAGHYAAKKSAALLGLGTDAVIEVPTDAEGAMIPAALDQAIGDAYGDRLTPFAVIATAGTTVTSAFDDLDAVADICRRRNVWLHVDGCYGGSALFSPSHDYRLAGVERSDSFVWNLHKMAGMTQQCTALLVRDPEQLDDCFAAGAEYLFQPDKLFGDLDAGDRTFQCARRVDVLKLWLTWKARGDAGFRARIERAVALADHARALVATSGGAFHALVPGSFTNVVFVWVPPELRPFDAGALGASTRSRLHRLAPDIKARMQAEGTGMVGFQPVGGLNAFRLLFMNPEVTEADVEAVLGLIDRYGSEAW